MLEEEKQGTTSDLYQDKTYYLRLNPARKTLSLYTEKFNTGGEYKPPSD